MLLAVYAGAQYDGVQRTLSLRQKRAAQSLRGNVLLAPGGTEE